MNKVYKQSMEVGYYFKEEVFNDNRTEDWCGSEECATFAKIIIDYTKENGCDINVAFHEIMEETINGINNETITIEEHGWDDYCKGFLAGEILGVPTKENLSKARKAEKLWEDVEYGYYQEVLEEVK